MHAEECGVLLVGQLSDVLLQKLQFVVLRVLVLLEGGGLEVLVHDLRVQVVDDDLPEQLHVVLVGDPAAIVDVRDERVDGLEINAPMTADLLRSEYYHCLLDADEDVSVHPVVHVVPADGPELLPFNDRRVEHHDREDHLLKCGRVELVLLRTEVVVDAQHVGLEALRRLARQLDATL